MLDVISALPETTSDPAGDPSENQFVHGLGRHLVIVPCTDVEIMPYCIQLLMTCFKVMVQLTYLHVKEFSQPKKKCFSTHLCASNEYPQFVFMENEQKIIITNPHQKQTLIKSLVTLSITTLLRKRL